MYGATMTSLCDLYVFLVESTQSTNYIAQIVYCNLGLG